jgi:hypothetical protein
VPEKKLTVIDVVMDVMVLVLNHWLLDRSRRVRAWDESILADGGRFSVDDALSTSVDTIAVAAVDRSSYGGDSAHVCCKMEVCCCGVWVAWKSRMFKCVGDRKGLLRIGLEC